MYVSKWMVKKVITVRKDTDIREAIRLMEKHSIRHLPVIEENRFVGFVTEGDLRQLLIPAMLEDIKVKDVMITEPITVTPETDIETAAKLIYEYKIGGLPVLKGKKLVGIITTTDILRAFIEMMGILMAGSRLDVVIGDSPEAFKEVYNIIHQHDGRLISLGILPNEQETIYSFRLEKCELEPIIKTLTKRGFRVISTFP
ncbi:MAG TPA: CBS domain-containing protein [Candidatus Desulfofervidus auxilii]|uniref:CBS domain-containing protein n=1 Tax=Desulfofervidus auxilii TaxID=1621989 RepID=A0A7V0I9X6_DESA2|nr:CBS domain-containing protein [Candidatus Desulfofervidus auxilii]